MAADQDSEQEGVFGSDNLSSAYLEPVTSEDEIDYSKVYALFTFVASMEGQISVLKGEPLDLLDDSNSYWFVLWRRGVCLDDNSPICSCLISVLLDFCLDRWAVKCISTTEIGYIPAENIETPYEKLARFNRSRNVELAEVKNMDLEKSSESKKPKRTTKLQFAEFVTEIYEDGEVEAEMPPAIPEKDGPSSSNSKQKQVSSMKLDEDASLLSGTPKKSSFIDVRSFLAFFTLLHICFFHRDCLEGSRIQKLQPNWQRQTNRSVLIPVFLLRPLQHLVQLQFPQAIPTSQILEVFQEAAR